MSSTGKSLLIELKASDALIDFDEYLSEIRTYLPSLNEDDTWIRSGIHIGEKYKKHITESGCALTQRCGRLFSGFLIQWRRPLPAYGSSSKRGMTWKWLCLID